MTTKMRSKKNSRMKIKNNNRNRISMRHKTSVKSQRVETHSRYSLAVLLRVQHPKKRALTKIHMPQGQQDQAPFRKAKTEKAQ